MEQESLQMIEGVLDDVRPPVLDFSVIDDNDDYTEYIIKTHKYSKEKKGENPFTNYLNSFIFCDDTLKIKVPKKKFMMKDGKKKFAYAIGMFPNPKNGKAAYLDGCILAGLGLKRQKTNADVVCFITHDISKKDKKKLEIVFDRVIYVPYISPYDMGGKGDLKTIMMDPEIFKNCPKYTKEHPYVHVFFKLHIFNPELFPYEKVCFVDSDLVPLNYYDSLFMVDTPAGFVEYRKRIPYLESYNWDRCDFLTHGEKIPKELTDIDKKTGADVNAGLLVIKPDKKEYDAMIKEITQPAKKWIGPNKLHKGFYTFDFDEPSGRSFIKDSYCYPEQNYLTKRYSGKWKYIEFAFQSWSRDPCNSFGIHMAAFNPKPWFKQPAGTKVHIDKKYNPYSEEWNVKKIRIPIAVKENTKSSYENISYSYEIFNEVIIWGLMNFPKLNTFFGRDIEIHGTKVSFDRDVFHKVSKKQQFVRLEDIDKKGPIYKKLSYTQKLICNLINDYDDFKDKKYTPICRRKKSKNANYEILNYKAKGGGKKRRSKNTRKKTRKKTRRGKPKKTRRKTKKAPRNATQGGPPKGATGENTILYYFTMNGCPYCNSFNPQWEKINKEFPNIKMKKIERNEDPQLIQKFNVSSFPNITLSKGKEFTEFDGNREDINMFRSFFKKNGIRTL
jgi:thiol-disulfide isomerase/thioredoxin